MVTDMQDICAPFKGKKITILGLGLLGRGVGDAEFLAECGADVVVTDKKTEEELAESVARLKKYTSILFHLGGHEPEDFTSCDMVIKAAGVPLDSPEVAVARAADVPVYMSTALFAKYAAERGAVIAGITGTRGKSTVAHMIFHTLQRAGRRSHLGGNIRGKSTLAMLSEVQEGDTCVLELDSWQLQGFGDLGFSPHIAAVSNLMPDHLNYYKGDMDAYFADKANIFLFQKPNDVLIAGASVVERIRELNPPLDPIVPESLPRDWKLTVLGEHNKENAALASAALAALGLAEKEIKTGLESFEGVEGRLQFVREVEGVRIYNDNNATTPEATIAALKALGENITLIIGGSEKNLDLGELVSEIKIHVSHVILLKHENYQGSERLAKELTVAKVPYMELSDIESALRSAVENTKKGAILFSPAFASFGMFKNEYDRNDQFLNAIEKL